MGEHLIKYVIDMPCVGDGVREQRKMKNLVGIQNTSVLYGIVMAWQHELVCLQTKDDTSNKKMLHFVRAAETLMLNCGRALAATELSEHWGFPSKPEAYLKQALEL